MGASPIAMTLGDVLPALQQGAVDGALAAITVFNAMQYQDAAKYITEIDQPAIFLICEISRKWYESLPKDLQKVVDDAAKKESININSFAVDFMVKSRKAWVDKGGELISLPPNEQATMMEGLASVGEDVSKSKPLLSAAYHVAVEAAKRTR
jgi:TRAP-type C4-dicarboxylate transport system substrate-binding protein